MRAVVVPSKRSVAALAFALVLGWQLAASIWAVACEVAGRDEPYSYRLFAAEEDRIRDELGSSYAILEALRAHVPAGGLVVVTARAEPDLLELLTTLRHLLYPRLLAPPDQALEIFAERGFTVGPDVLVLDLDPGAGDHWQPPASAALDPVVTGDAFALWRGRDPNR